MLKYAIYAWVPPYIHIWRSRPLHIWRRHITCIYERFVWHTYTKDLCYIHIRRSHSLTQVIHLSMSLPIYTHMKESPVTCMKDSRCIQIWRIRLTYIYCSFHWNCYTPKIHHIEKVRFHGTNSYWNLDLIWMCTEEIKFLDSVDLGGGSIYIGNWHMKDSWQVYI